jgi:hypothetical protein
LIGCVGLDCGIETEPIRYEDLRVDGSVFKFGAAGNDPDFDVLTGALRAWNFDLNDEVFFSVQFPHAWREGTAISPHLHVVTSGTNANPVKFTMDYAWADINGTYPGVNGSVYGTMTPPGVALTHKILNLDSAAIATAGKKLSSILLCRLTRVTNGATDNTDDVFVTSFDIHLQCDGIGSRGLSSK